MTAVDDFLGIAPSWHILAACRGMDPDLFFPERGASTREAKAICTACPVRVDCLAQAFTTGERHGIWGGLSERQRRTTRRDTGIRTQRRTISLVHGESLSPAAIRQRAVRAKTVAAKVKLPMPDPSVDKILEVLGYIEKRFT